MSELSELSDKATKIGQGIRKLLHKGSYLAAFVVVNREDYDVMKKHFKERMRALSRKMVFDDGKFAGFKEDAEALEKRTSGNVNFMHCPMYMKESGEPEVIEVVKE